MYVLIIFWSDLVRRLDEIGFTFFIYNIAMAYIAIFYLGKKPSNVIAKCENVIKLILQICKVYTQD